MDKPKKKGISEQEVLDIVNCKVTVSFVEHTKKMGYNQACEDWEKFLPSEKEIDDAVKYYFSQGKLNDLAKSLSKRIKNV